MPGASPQAETWGLLATAWARQGETEKAAKWLRQASCLRVQHRGCWDTLLGRLLVGDWPKCLSRGEFVSFFSKVFIIIISIFFLHVFTFQAFCDADTHTNVG